MNGSPALTGSGTPAKLLGCCPPPAQYGVVVVSVFLVVTCVRLHYEVLHKLSDWLDRLHQLHRTRVLVLILGLLVAHIVDLGYAAGYGLLDEVPGFGSIEKASARVLHGDWLDYVCFSFVNYSTVGYGDLEPTGPFCLIAATEALNGWVRLGCSASSTFLEMQRFWRAHKP